MSYEEAHEWVESHDFYKKVPGMNEGYRRLLAFPVVHLHPPPGCTLDPVVADIYIKAVVKYQSSIAIDWAALAAVGEET